MWTRFCLNLAQLPDCIINVFATLPNDFYLVKMAESSRLSGPHRFPLRLYRVCSFYTVQGFFFVLSVHFFFHFFRSFSIHLPACVQFKVRVSLFCLLNDLYFIMKYTFFCPLELSFILHSLCDSFAQCRNYFYFYYYYV